MIEHLLNIYNQNDLWVKECIRLPFLRYGNRWRHCSFNYVHHMYQFTQGCTFPFIHNRHWVPSKNPMRNESLNWCCVFFRLSIDRSWRNQFTNETVYIEHTRFISEWIKHKCDLEYFKSDIVYIWFFHISLNRVNR